MISIICRAWGLDYLEIWRGAPRRHPVLAARYDSVTRAGIDNLKEFIQIHNANPDIIARYRHTKPY